MEKIEYKVLKKYVPDVKLNSVNGGYWYNFKNELIPWYDDNGDPIDENLIPEIGYIVKNINDIEGLVLNGFYKWSGTIWEIINDIGEIYNVKIPILLTETVQNLGIMSEFDGDIEEQEQKFNFIYSGETQSKTITVYNSVNTNKFKFIKNSTFKVEWGDGSWDMLDVISTGSTIPNISHTYALLGSYTIRITQISDWNTYIVEKTIKIPYSEVILDHDLKFEINEYKKLTGYTNGVEITGETISRLEELRKYGTNNNYTSIIVTTEYTGYSFTYTGTTESGSTITEKIIYRDYNDGKTIVFIPENRDVFINTLIHGELYNGKITRNEHFIGFVEEPTIYSDIFVERGKLGVMERNFRLSEIESTGELENYGNGFFDVRKQ